MHSAGKLFMIGVVALFCCGAAARSETKASPAMPIGGPAFWFGPQDYPPAAMRAEEEGRVRFRVQIDATGRPTDCAIEDSSHSATLDQATCAILMAHGTFNPARNDEGEAISGIWRSAVKWTMPRDRPPAEDTRITFAGNGDSIVCHASLEGKPLPDWTPKACGQLVATLRGVTPELPPYVIISPEAKPNSPPMAPR